MSDDEPIVERRSMVGAPPSSAPKRASTARMPKTPATSRAKSKRKREDSDDEPEKEAKHEAESDTGDLEDSGDDDEDTRTPKAKKSRRSKKLLTDSTARKKRTEAKKKAEKEFKEAAGIELFEEKKEKPPSPQKEPTPEPVAKAPCISQYSALQLMCDHLLRKVQSKDPEEFFAFPVTPSMAPDYHTIISKPMDFSAMRQKIEDNEYESIPQMRTDADLIVSNALTYNNPNTVYHMAAARLGQIIRYYFSEQYLRYMFHTLPFANQVPLEKVGLPPLAPIPKIENKRALAVADNISAKDCLEQADVSVRSKLSTRTPAKIAFLDNKDGATVLNVIGSTEKKEIKLIDIVGPLEEGNPGILALSDHRLSSVTPISYLNYGPFSSFAPQYDSTWASLSKRDSDLLLRTYGDRSTASEVFSLRNMVVDADEVFVKAIDDLLDTLTGGEHTRTMSTLESKKETTTNMPLDDLLKDVESLENLGIDTSFVEDIRQRTGAPKPTDIQYQLDQTGQAILDLAHIQNQRLSKPPPISLNKVVQPPAIEVHLAGHIQQQLVTQVSTHAQPGQLTSAPILQNAMAIDIDTDILNEFFM